MLSEEAQTFRSLLRVYVRARLHKSGLPSPAALARTASNAPDTERAFLHVVAEFDSMYGEQLVSMLGGWPRNLSDIDTFVIGVVSSMLANGHGMRWGHIIAIAAFVGVVAVNCAQHEMPQAIEPLVECVAHVVDRDMSAFIREHDGWAAFALAFRERQRETSAATPVVVSLIAALCITAIFAFM
jgi:hypothetical protein